MSSGGDEVLPRTVTGSAAANANREHLVTRGVVLRRTWPQRLMVIASAAVIVFAIGSARSVEHVQEVWQEVNRVVIVDTGQYGGAAGPLLRPDTEPGAPVNFLIVGTDSALGLDPDDPVLHQRVVDPTGRSLADAIMLVRLDPAAESAWVMSIPRDLWAEIPRAQDNRISSALYIGGAERLVETVVSMFNIEINHYISLDLAGFKEVVDTLGGVPVWFPNPVRDPGSGLNIATAGCHVLNGEQALQYVRSRRYTEQIDGRWQITGGNDFSRIERQQGFLVLALDRAVNRGARNPSTMLSLLESAIDSMTLDQDLTLAELRNLGSAFADFKPDNLNRLRLEVYQVRWPDDTYKGEMAYKRANEPVLDVFRGLADSVRPYDVTLTISAVDHGERDETASLLSDEGFSVNKVAVAATLPETVVLHGSEDRPAAITLAQYLDPLPHVVEAADISGVVLAVGDDFRGVLTLYQEPLAEIEARVAERPAPPLVPNAAAILAAPIDVGSEPAVDSGASAGSEPAGGLGDSAAGSELAGGLGNSAAESVVTTAVLGAAEASRALSRSGTAAVASALLATTASVAQETPEPEPPGLEIPGRPPEGETCV